MQIQTSRQAGGIASSDDALQDLGVLDALAGGIAILEAPAATPAGDPRRSAVGPPQSRHRTLALCGEGARWRGGSSTPSCTGAD